VRNIFVRTLLVLVLGGAAPLYAAEITIDILEDGNDTIQISTEGNRLILSGKSTVGLNYFTFQIPEWRNGTTTMPEYRDATSLDYRKAIEVAKQFKHDVESDSAYHVIISSTDDLHAEAVVEEPVNLPSGDPEVKVEGLCKDYGYLYGPFDRSSGLANIGNTIIFRRQFAGWYNEYECDGCSDRPAEALATLPRVIDLGDRSEAQSAFVQKIDYPATTRQAAEALSATVNNTPKSGYTATALRVVSKSGAEIGWGVSFEAKDNMLILRD
jgi:hypothetical protein